MKKIKNIFSALVIGSVMVIVTSCGKDPNSPGIEYMPDMYRSPSYETYSLNPNFTDSTSARMPVAGTIPRGFLPYPYPNDTSGYAAAGKQLKNPVALNPEVLAQGEVLYTKFCLQCHGAEGKGDGTVGGKLPGAPPSYSGTLKDLPEGKIFHSITYGKGLMGPHAPLLNQEERWKLVHYVQKLQKLGSPATTSVSDSTAQAKDKAEKK